MDKTTPEREQQEQKNWVLREKFADVPWFDQLLRSEFRDPADHDRKLGEILRAYIRHAAWNVPYYRDLFEKNSIRARRIRSVNDLAQIPSLSKVTLKKEADRLRSQSLPAGEKWGQRTSSSGTTGEKTIVEHTVRSRFMFGLLKQRELRWFRFDPEKPCAWIRMGTSIPRNEEGRSIGFGETFILPHWPVVGGYFRTGPTPATTENNPIDWLADWMLEYQPVNIIASTATLEHLAFTCQDNPGAFDLRRAQALATHVSEKTAARISNILGATTRQNYGLNEIGIVASQCREGGRYHVHTEHCLVEIVDEDGVAVAPGEMGRLLVTSLTNLAMPLIRYDSGDMAIATDGGCSCGRTLPTFERIVGRRERMEVLPPGTLTIADTLFDALEGLALNLSKNIQKYQIHQKINGDFELRLVVSGELSPDFQPYIRTIWTNANESYQGEFTIREVPFCPLIPSNKYAYLTSEFITPEDGNWTKKPEEF